MSNWLSRLVERQILKAQATGQLTGLAGEGEPLPERPGDAFISAGDAAGFRIMAEAGVLPPEIELKKQVAAALQELAALTDPDARKAAMARLADLQMRQAMAEESRRAFLRP
ncbi:J-domain-containing protein [Phaeovulum sp. W22_SRMD_FR3]|uniref:DnaJ family domain-containing protein n=1 Tax=Phaeovulum sp. W22_SRMD_FR3 TaxID=3240274 RepID=UPI003F9EB699